MITSERLCVYTVLTEGFEDLLDQSVAEHSDVDFICFTDDPSIISNTWTIRPLELMFTQDPARSSRVAKLCTHRVLPEYDVSLYIDNTVRLRKTPESIVGDLLPTDAGVVALSHAWRLEWRLPDSPVCRARSGRRSEREIRSVPSSSASAGPKP